MAFILSLSFHEAAHAFVAAKLGDKTAFHHGLVTLDPLAHMRREPIGMIVLPIISYLFNGWMIGWASTPFDPDWARRHPKREIMMALAGPAANLLLVLLAAVIIRIGILAGWFSPPDSTSFSHVTDAVDTGWTNGLSVMVSILFTLNLVLFVFNLLPVPPLDGSSLVPLFLSDENAYKYKEFIRTPTNSIIGLIIVWQVFGYIFSPIQLFAINLLYPGIHYGF
ncbi:MAG: site-2 protease family protein [Phycisphaerae bacterium]